MSDFEVHLAAGQYQRDVNALRQHLEVQGVRSGFLTISLYPPTGGEALELKMRCSDAYIIGFRGGDQWYFLEGDKPADEKGASTGVGGNYNDLGSIPAVTADMFEGVLALKGFQHGQKLRGGLIVLVAAVVSEAVRSATVATYFTGLFNGVLTVVPLSVLKDNYFLNWSSHSKSGSSDVLLKK